MYIWFYLGGVGGGGVIWVFLNHQLSSTVIRETGTIMN